MYIDLHNAESVVKQAKILAWIPKIIGRNCLLALLLLSEMSVLVHIQKALSQLN